MVATQIFFIFHPENRGRWTQIWRAYFSIRGWLKPPTRGVLFVVNLIRYGEKEFVENEYPEWINFIGSLCLSRWLWIWKDMEKTYKHLRLESFFVRSEAINPFLLLGCVFPVGFHDELTTANHWNWKVGFHDNPENTPGGGMASWRMGWVDWLPYGEVMVRYLFFERWTPFFESWWAFVWGKKWFNVCVKH